MSRILTTLIIFVPAVIVVINNDGYLIERLLHEDGP
jgi:TPP-dependent 2-oxoacid decarboxylase